MSRKRTREYKNGDTLTAYINNTVDENLLDWLNKQSDVTGAIFLALLKLYEETGHIDVVDYIPRRYSLDVPLPTFPGQFNDVSKDHVRPSNSEDQHITSTKPVSERIVSTGMVDKQTSPLPIQTSEVKGVQEQEDEQQNWLGGLKNVNVDNF